MAEITYVESAPVTDEELATLLGREPDGSARPYQRMLERSLAWFTARDGETLVGFVNVATDGGEHAFLLDPTVRADYRRRGIGTALVRAATEAARRRGATWLHVDFESSLEEFYRRAGFRPTYAGLIRLDGAEPAHPPALPPTVAPLPMPPPVPSPFVKLRAFGLIVQCLIGGIVVMALSRPMWGASPSVNSPIPPSMFYFGMGLVLLARARLADLDLERLFGPPVRPATLKLALVAFPLMCLSMAGLWVLFMPISYFAPRTVHDWLARANDMEPPHTLGLWFAHMGMAVILAPVIEEVMFRGLLLQRWALKWGTMPAVIASSMLFAICHIELLGHFLFAIAMCALYLRTRSLWVPIAAHALNNFVASIASLADVLRPGKPDAGITVETIQSGWHTGATFLVAGVALLVLYDRRIWERLPLAPLLRGPVPYVNEPAAIPPA